MINLQSFNKWAELDTDLKKREQDAGVPQETNKLLDVRDLSQWL